MRYPPWPSDADLDRLVQSASGQFIYAATVLKFVDDEYSHPFERLRLVLNITASDTSIFSDLDALYTFILSANPDVSLLVRILGTYFAIPHIEDHQTHCISFLDEILNVLPGTVRSALRGVHSLLLIPDSDDVGIRVYHASLSEFLKNESRARRFYMSPGTCDEQLMARCLSVVADCSQTPDQYSS
ncbi:hypothetical protein C8J57DRAFT_1116197, partial [Mycena rebaudengoi]